MEALLEISGLDVDFNTPRGRVHALRGVTMTIPKGRILGVVGESGSGKTTLIWSIMQLLASNSTVGGGEVRFRGEDVMNFGTDALRSFRGEEAAMVFQDPMTSQSPVLCYRQQMTDILYRRAGLSNRDKAAAAVQMMRRVGIPDPESRILHFPHQFSGGMRQRAGIAMALLMDPSLLIADEPTTALDVTMEAQIIHLIREARAEFDATVMLVSHNLGLIAELCDEVAVMYAGEIVEHGEVHDIFFHAKHPYTRALLRCNPAHELVDRRFFPTIPGDVPDLHEHPVGCVFAPRCPQAADTCCTQKPADSTLPGEFTGERQTVRCHIYDPETYRCFATPSAPMCGSVSEAEEPAATTRSAEPLLAIDGLRIRFPSMGRLRAAAAGVKDPFVDAVLDVSLALAPGETLGLAGESGSGKTTLGRSVVGLSSITSGSVKFRGVELAGLSQRRYKRVRRDISMMFQDPVGSLSPRRNVEQLLTEPFSIHGVRDGRLRQQALRLCDMVSLPANFLSRYPHELSGGQARRVGVARALALNPALVIADEPTAGLDVSVQGEILNLMIELQDKYRLAYLIISHNLPVIRQISNRLAVMYLGRIVEQGDCETVFQTPAHPYSEALVRGTPNPDPTRRRKLLSVEGEVPSLTNRPGGCEFHPRCPYATDRCRNEAPTETALSGGRTVRCHFPLVA